AAAPVAAIAGRDDDGSSKALAIAALIVGALGLIAASVALLRGRRRTAV
ncbi:MAG: hypothetical protein JWP17_4183, partial [Solirubrobacterales bacterium]|nr:hypothetical protein [Solirubrobacterales bacterium]